MSTWVPGVARLFGGFTTDTSAWTLVAANLFAAGVAFATNMGVSELLVVFWIQSVIIGLCATARTLFLRSYAKLNGTVENSPGERLEGAFYFLLIYGSLHGVFLFILMVVQSETDLFTWLPAYWLCALIFAADHAYSLVRNIRADEESRPDVAQLTLLPFVRVVPMYVAIAIGSQLAPYLPTLPFLFALKITVDVMSHLAEHRKLRYGRFFVPPS